MLNAFTDSQISVIEELAGLFWETNHRKMYGNSDEYILSKVRRRYVDDIINGLVDPAIWGDYGYRD